MHAVVEESEEQPTGNSQLPCVILHQWELNCTANRLDGKTRARMVWGFAKDGSGKMVAVAVVVEGASRAPPTPRH